jgi:serine/threonine protein kinase
LHRGGLVHKDYKPSNVLVNSETGHVRIMVFGIGSRVPRERQSPEPPEFIAGTLPYMAPEQTGRMNRSIDSRSDLYALGVTLYEMLTGSLPFRASDQIEWVHCHIARYPMTPGERLRNIPDSVSAIIMRLLAKTAEERYQTAAGAECDFRRCLAEWETARRIDEFPLGESASGGSRLTAVLSCCPSGAELSCRCAPLRWDNVLSKAGAAARSNPFFPTTTLPSTLSALFALTDFP